MSFFGYQFMKVYHHSWGRSTEENFFSQEMIEKSHGSIHHARCVQVWEMTVFFLLSEAGGREELLCGEDFFARIPLYGKKRNTPPCRKARTQKRGARGGRRVFSGKGSPSGGMPFVQGPEEFPPHLRASDLRAGLACEHVFQFVQHALRRNARDAGVRLRAGACAVQGTGAAGHVELHHAILFS